jgi:lipopolysaccharide transport system ATP-binding protein
MSDVVVRVEGLGKEYRLGGRPAYTTLGEQLRNWSPLRGLLGRGRADAPPPFWALKDVSFEVKRGEVVGIIGRNGAGKSTLLKILSRITEPTEGRADIHGRVGSLLEVGTGFHPELTGRENVYLNGAILGMRRSEVRAKFDDIVGFAEVEKFIDTPVKHYSSGMYTRLAFAVAAHLEPEILIVDEVLAVGDAQFQQKCLGKMGEVAKGGRTVLFVSHNMTAVSTLCTRAICLHQGHVIANGAVISVIRSYRQTTISGTEWKGECGDENLKVHRTWVRSLGSDGSMDTAAPLEVGVALTVLKPVTGLVIGFNLISSYGQLLAHVLYDDNEQPPPPTVERGSLSVCTVIPANTLAKGGYEIEFDVGIWAAKRILETQANLVFSLERTSGLGGRFPEPEVPTATSLFRPAWQTTVSRVMG